MSGPVGGDLDLGVLSDQELRRSLQSALTRGVELTIGHLEGRVSAAYLAGHADWSSELLDEAKRRGWSP